MKKIFTPLLLASILFIFNAEAQNTPDCNTAFNVALSNIYTAKFTPALTTDSALVRHEWNFGDASAITHLIAPTHSYAAPGTYTVTHNITRFNPNGILVCHETIKKQVIIKLPCSLIANFNWHADSLNYQKIHFSNNSSPSQSSDSVKWTFGDGTSSTDINPTHVYTKTGTYNACITIKTKGDNAGSEACAREICKTVVVGQPCTLQANFIWNPIADKPGAIAFKNLSIPLTPTDSVRWTFGDGSSSTDINVNHVYASAGTYTACLRIKARGSNTDPNSCVREICKTISIGQTCNLQVGFNWNLITDHPFAIEFQNLSGPLSPTDSVSWAFGDGSTSQGIQMKHTYDHDGVYTVCLRIKKNFNLPGTAPCVREFCKIVTIPTLKNCDSVRVNFAYKRDPVLPNKIYFTAYSNTTIQDQYWTISRLNNNSQPSIVLNQKNPDFAFKDTGYYSVCLKAVDPGGCTKAYCSTIRIERLPQECDLHAYPNPAANEIKIAVQLLQPEMIHVYIYNSMNVLVKEKNQQGNAGSNGVGIEVHNWLPGFYTIKVVYGNKICYTRFTKL